MTMLQYPAKVTRTEGGFVVRLPAFPEAITDGKTVAEAMEEAADLLGSVIAHRIKRRENIPAPSEAKRGQVLVPVPMWVAGKLAVYQAMRTKGYTNVELAALMDVGETVVRRILAPQHETKHETMARALSVLGQRVVMAVEAA